MVESDSTPEMFTYELDVMPHTDRGEVVSQRFTAASDAEADSYARADAWEYAGVTLWRVSPDGTHTRVSAYGMSTRG